MPEKGASARLPPTEVTGVSVKWNYLLSAVLFRQLWGK